MTLTEDSKQLFIRLAKMAGDWNGMPLLDITKEQRGNLTQLKRAKLLTTERQEGFDWVVFTDAGRAFAKENGTDIDWTGSR